jgi:hypothetical protein
MRRYSQVWGRVLEPLKTTATDAEGFPTDTRFTRLFGSRFLSFRFLDSRI